MRRSDGTVGSLQVATADRNATRGRFEGPRWQMDLSGDLPVTRVLGSRGGRGKSIYLGEVSIVFSWRYNPSFAQTNDGISIM
jgi:hypothetical protein